MPIVRKATRDPLTGYPNRLHVPAGGVEEAAVILASSSAALELRKQVEEYCRRRISGRSVLVGGERGSGKTTLTGWVVEQILASGQLRADAQPLLVPIHGPDFFDGLDAAAEPEAAGPPAGAATVVVNYGTSGGGQQPDKELSDSEKTAVRKQREKARARFALKVLTSGLHRAFITDLGWALERRADWICRDAPADQRDELSEIVAQLRLELDTDVDAARLRGVWQQLDALQEGVLRRETDVARRDYWTNQGLLEIIATKSLIEGYIRVAGKVEDLKTNLVAAELQRERSDEGSRKLAHSLVGTLSGGAAGAGILFSGTGGSGKALLAALAIPVVAFLTTVFLNLASKLTLRREDSEERKITFDKSLESLDLIFPLLVNRVLDAGRAPIFVVDELDKVPQTDTELADLIPRLKHIVSDKAFFCFLVDRECFDKIQSTIREKPRCSESTFFGRRLYVNQRPLDWRDYLVGKAGPGKTLIQSICDHFEPGTALLGSDATDQAARGTDAAYLFCLSYYLLARSFLHAGDLQRLIDAWPLKEGALEPVDLERPQYKNVILYQAAVEAVLGSPDLAQRVESDIEFRQLLYDTLYWPLKEWEQGKLQKSESASAGLFVNPKDSVLKKAREQFLRFLSDPAQLNGALTDVDLRQILGTMQPLLAMPGGEGDWRWLFDFQGNSVPWRGPLPLPSVQATKPKPEVLQAIEWVNELNRAIVDWTDSYLDLNKLAVEIHLLDLSPLFPSFQSAAASYLANAGSGEDEMSYPSMESDKFIIGEFHSLAERSMRAIKQAFFLAELMATQFPSGRSPERIYRSLVTLADELEFSTLAISEVEAVLTSFKDDFFWMDQPEKETGSAFEKIGSSTESEWLSGILLGIKSRGWPEQLPDTLIPDYFRDRLDALLRSMRTGEKMARLRLRGLFLRVVNRVAQFRGLPKNVTLENYARLLEESVRFEPKEFVLVLLAELGFGQHISEVAMEDQSLDPALALELIGAAKQRIFSGERVLLILRDPPAAVKIGDEMVQRALSIPSVCQGWLPSQQHAIHPVFASTTFLYPWTQFSLVFVDGDSIPGVAIPTSVPLYRLVTSGDKKPGATIINASGIDEAVAQAKRLMPPPSVAVA